MSTHPFFIGRMTDPVVAHVLHLSALDFQVTKFLREQIKNHTITENDSVVLIADAHLNAKPSALRLLRKSITSTNIKIAGVFGEHGQIWAQYMEIPYLTEKPRMSMNDHALEQRRNILQNAVQNEHQEELNVVHDIVNQAIDAVDKVQELHTQRTALLSFEQRQQQKSATVTSNVSAPATKSVDDLRAALHQRKPAVEAHATSIEVETAIEEIEPTIENVPVIADQSPKNVESANSSPQLLSEEIHNLLASHSQSASDNTENPQNEEVVSINQSSVDQNCEQSAPEHVEAFVGIGLSEDEQKAAEEEDRRFEEQQKHSHIIRSSLAVEAPCQSSLGQDLPNKQTVSLERMAVKPLRVRGRIRSGQTLHHLGDVIVEGSVHPSGEVAAHGDIHVYGTGGGHLFAGIDGNVNACIYIALFDAEIVSIAGHYYVIEDSYNNWSGRSIKVSLEDGILNFEEIRLMPQRAA